MSALTKVSLNQGATVMRILARSLLPSLSWRHHGIGVLQGYVVEGDDPELRVHIWSPELVKPGMKESGSVHDHRFDMVSHVLAGTVVHEEWFCAESPTGSHTTMLLTHARAAADTKFHGPTEPTGERLSVRINPMVVGQGFSYSFPAGHFHCNPVAPGVAVTLVEKHRQRAVPARILHPIDTWPVMAFGHDIDPGLLARTVRAALAALGEAKP